MKTYAIRSKSLNQEIGRFEADKDDKEAMWINKLAALRFFVELLAEGPPIVRAEPFLVTSKTVSASCTISMYDHAVQRIGEAGIDEPNPATLAFERAFVAAAIDLFQLSLKEIKTEDGKAAPAKHKAPEHKAAPKAPEPRKAVEKAEPLKDLDIILFGNLKGQKYGEVKSTEQFKNFLAQLAGVENMAFPDAAKQKQFSQLMALAKGTL